MAFVQAKCPNCGGFLAVDNTNDAAICQFCNTPFIVKKAINNYNITVNGNVNVNRATLKIEGAPSINNLLIRARSFVSSGEYSRAIEYYNRILDLDPYNTEAKREISIVTIPQRNNLLVFREKALSASIRKLYIILDDKIIGTVKDGESIGFQIPLGRHSLKFKLASMILDGIEIFLPSGLQCAKFSVKPGLSLRANLDMLTYRME